jgi:hypothetical protein
VTATQGIFISPNNIIGSLIIQGGKDNVTSVGEINSKLDFGSNDASVGVNDGYRVGGRISSVTEFSNGAYVGMAFYTYYQGRTPDLLEAMRITSGGNVGIGTTGPFAKLQVESNDYSIISYSTSAFSSAIYGENTNAGVGIEAIANSGTGLIVRSNTGNIASFFGASGGEKVTLKNNGNLLIGTTTDNGAKLQVNGGVFINGVTSNVLISHGEKFIPLSGPNSVHSFDVATEFPSLAISGNVLGVTMFITIFGSGGSVYTAIATIARNSSGTWASYGLTASSSTVSLLQSVTGSGTTITINTNVGSYVGVKVTAITQ